MRGFQTLNMKILIVDIETTGLNPKNGSIVEVGIVELDLENGNRKIIYDKLCHQKPITLQHVQNCWIVEMGYITVDQIRTSIDFVKIKAEIQEIINAYPNGITAYNKKFDVGFLEAAGIEFPKVLDCPMILSTPLCELPSTYKGHGKFKYPKVEECYDFLFPDNDYTEIHRGGDDALHEAEIVYELYKREIFKV